MVHSSSDPGYRINFTESDVTNITDKSADIKAVWIKNDGTKKTIDATIEDVDFKDFQSLTPEEKNAYITHFVREIITYEEGLSAAGVSSPRLQKDDVILADGLFTKAELENKTAPATPVFSHDLRTTPPALQATVKKCGDAFNNIIGIKNKTVPT